MFNEIISDENCYELIENKSVASKFDIKLYMMLFLLIATLIPIIV